MATSRKVFSLAKPSEESAQMASRLLQENHEVNIIIRWEGKADTWIEICMPPEDFTVLN
jgi:hypothetical protein